MKKLGLLAAVLLFLAILPACARPQEDATQEDAAGILALTVVYETTYEKAYAFEPRPFQSLTAADIVSATVRVPRVDGMPQDITDIDELVRLLNAVELVREDNTVVYGGGYDFQITKTDGSEIAVRAFGKYISIDSVQYLCKDEPGSALCSFGERLLDGAGR